MESARAIGSCLEHIERSGLPCTRCGTFRCGECLNDGLCPLCRNASVHPPRFEDAVGFGRRAWGRIIDLLGGQVAGVAGGVLAGVVLVVLQLTGFGREGWEHRLDHGFLFSFLSGSTASVLGSALCTAICGASMGKMFLGLRVVSMSGERPGFLASFVRELAYFIDAFFFGLVAKGQMDNSPLQQRLGDKWGNTVVVQAASLAPGVGTSTQRAVFGVGVGLLVQALVLTVFFVVAGR